MSAPQCRLDRLVNSPGAQWAAFVWGFAEATLFFIVPDVLISVLGCRSIKAGLKASRNALLGALLGGMLMFAWGSHSPQTARTALTQIPAIHPKLIGQVQSQLATYHLGAVLIGPLIGIPYKIYAVEWGAAHGSLLLFLLISIPARGIRFLLSGLLAGGMARWLSPWTKSRPLIELSICSLFWILFYAFYFKHFSG